MSRTSATTSRTSAAQAGLRLGERLRQLRVAAGMTQTDEVHSGGSYLSQNDLRLHFGLGSATRIDSIEIRWPSGLVEKIPSAALAIDRHYSILEGKGVVSDSAIRPTRPAAR